MPSSEAASLPLRRVAGTAEDEKREDVATTARHDPWTPAIPQSSVGRRPP